jgi:hypothetical protein
MKRMAWIGAFIFAGFLTQFFRWLLKTNKPTNRWRYGPHAFSLAFSLIAGTFAGVGGANPGSAALSRAFMLYVPMQLLWMIIEQVRPTMKATGLN